MSETKTPPPKRAAARKTLNLANLESLGAERLAAAMLEVADDYPAVKRRLRLELAGEAGAEALGAEIAKRLETIGESRSRIHWRRYKEFVRDLSLNRRAIAGRLAELDPAAALTLIIHFIALHPSISDRSQDARGEIEAEFETAVTDANAIAPRVKLLDPRPLSDQLYALLDKGTPGLAVLLLMAVAAALPPAVIADLRQRVQAIVATGRRGVSPALRPALQILADAAGDVDGYIDGFTPGQRVLPPVGAQIATRLITSGRLDEARAALEHARPEPPAGPRGVDEADDWWAAWISLMEAGGDEAAAQAARWTRFTASLSPALLRAYLKRLPDFDDVEAEDRAMDEARGHPDLTRALGFALAWPALDVAAELVLERRAQLSGQDASLLSAAAKALETRHPLAATLLLRAVIWDVVRYARIEFYKDAQRHLLEAESLAPGLTDSELETHEDFVKRVAMLRRW